MKRFAILSLSALLIAVLFTACAAPASSDPTQEPVDTSPLIILDESASPSLTPGTSPSLSAGASATSSPSPSASATVMPTATENPDAVDTDIATSFKSLVKASEYVLIVEVTKDNGVVDVLKGTDTAALAPNAYIGEQQYTVKVTEVLKSSGSKTVKANDSITYSMPYEYSMNKQTKPITKESSFIALEAGKSYALFIKYDSEMKYFSPSDTEPNKFELKDNKLYIHTAQSDLSKAWNAGSSAGTSLANLKSAAK